MALPQRTRRLPPARCNFTFSDCLQLVKPKVTGLSLLTAAAGYRLGSTAAPDLGKFLGTVFCTFLAAAGGSVLNQYMDRDTDSLMSRTANRPLPALRMSPGRVLIAGVILSISATVSLGVWIKWYLLAAGLLGLTFIVCAILLDHPLSEGRARLNLKAGVIYLPCLLIAMVIDRV